MVYGGGKMGPYQKYEDCEDFRHVGTADASLGYSR